MKNILIKTPTNLGAFYFPGGTMQGRSGLAKTGLLW